MSDLKKENMEEAGLVEEGLFSSLVSIFSSKHKNIQGLQKSQEALEAIYASLSDVEDVSPSRVSYVRTMLQKIKEEIDFLMYAVEKNKKVSKLSYRRPYKKQYINNEE